MKLTSKIILFILMIIILLNLKPNTASAAALVERSYMLLVTTNSYLRSSNSSSSPIITTIPANRTVIYRSLHIIEGVGTEFKAEGMIDVEYDGITGYVLAENLKPVENNISFRRVTSDKLALRRGPSTSDYIITTIPQNEIVTYWGNATSDFAEVYYKNTIGWVSRKCLANLKAGDTKLNPSIPFKDNWRLVNSDSLDLRSKPSNNAKLIETIPQYAKVEYLGEKSGTSPNIFAKVNYDGVIGWVLAKNLSNFKCFQVPDNTRVVLTNLYLRNGPANSYNVKLTIPKGSIVTYSGKKQNGFAEVSYRGTTGWVLASSLSKFNYEVTYVNYSSRHVADNRSYNMDLAAKTLSQTIIMPGELFSVLNILGDCTEEKGYKNEGSGYFIGSKELIGYKGYLGYHSAVSHISAEISYNIQELGIYSRYDFHDTKFVNTLNKPLMLTLISSNGNMGFMVSTLEAK